MSAVVTFLLSAAKCSVFSFAAGTLKGALLVLIDETVTSSLILGSPAMALGWKFTSILCTFVSKGLILGLFEMTSSSFLTLYLLSGGVLAQ